MIKNIIFDLGNVIINYDQEKIAWNFAKNDEEVKYIFDEIFDAPEWAMQDLGEITIEGAINNINERNNNKYPELTRKFLEEWFKLQRINREIADLAKTLKNNDYKVFVLSNMATPTYEFFKNDEFFRACDGIIISAEEHVKKPDEKIYRILLDRFGLTAEDCVFIDDDLSDVNYKTANRIGIKGRRIIPNDVEDVKKMLLENEVKI